ncbi:Polyadenylate-binding protein rbp47c' [Sarracenia purpurea var. burkii]
MPKTKLLIKDSRENCHSISRLLAIAIRAAYLYTAWLRGYISNDASAQGSQSDGDSTNTTIFVGGLDPNVNDEDLRQPFSQYGEIVSVKIPVGKGCGFVQFGNRNNAEEALHRLNGTTIGKQTLRADFGNPWSAAAAGPYYGGQMYDGYGYALPPPRDPSMYAAAAAAYGAYPMYGTHQQQVS